MEKDLKSKICKNCNTAVTGNFCMHCGQSTRIAKITIKDTFKDFLSNTFSVDAPLLLTLKLLLLNPGKLYREFLEGKRKTYYKPVPFFILTTIILILIRFVVKYDPFQNLPAGDLEDPGLEQMIATGKFMSKNINNFLLLFVITLSLSLKLFFRKSYSLAEYLAISFYIIGVYTLVAAISVFLIKFISSKLQYIPFLVIGIYMVYAFNSLFQKKKVRVTIKTLVLYALAIFLYIVLGFSLSFLIISFKC